MKPALRKLTLAFAVFLTLFVTALFALCADAAPPAPTPGPSPAAAPLVVTLLPIIVPFITGLLKVIFPKLPKWSLPLLTIGQGLLVGVLSDETVSGLIGGAGGVGVYETQKRLRDKTGILALLAALLIPISFIACTTLSDQQANQLRDISQRAVQSAVTIELSVASKQRPYIEASLKQITECIDQGKVTATVLGKIVNALPVDPNVVRYTTTGLILFDGLSFLWLTPASDRALLSIAGGIQTGLQNALAAVPVNSKARPGALATASKPTPAPPAPRWQDDPKTGLKKNVIPVR